MKMKKKMMASSPHQHIVVDDSTTPSTATSTPTSGDRKRKPAASVQDASTMTPSSSNYDSSTVVATADMKPGEPTVRYHLNDFVYIETSKSEPFEIGQIDAIVQKRNGVLELQVRTFLRRQDVPIVLILSTENEHKLAHIKSNADGALHELYYNTRIVKPFAPQQLRGKCVVVQFVSEVEDPKDYVKLKDTFFYRLKYKHISSTTGNGHGNGSGSSSSSNNNNNGNSMQQPFLYPLEEGSMRVGAEYQAVVPPFALSQEEQAVHYKDHSPETLCYTPKHNLSEDDIEGFVKVCQSVSTFGRTKVLAFVLPAEEQQLPPPGALEVGASSVRDYTTQCAMDMLHIYNYDIGAATLSLVPKEKPVICHEPLQNWTTEEVARFREGFEKVGKNFRALRQQYLPQKELGHIVTFYYMMKHFLSLKGRSSDGSPQSQQQKQLSPSETSSGGGGGGSRTLYGKSSGGGVTKAKTAATKSSLIANNNNHHHNIGHRLGCKRMLKSIDIPERYHTDCHALSPEKSRRCDSCLATLLCRTYPAGMLVYALCLDCRAHWQRMASFRILDA